MFDIVRSIVYFSKFSTIRFPFDRQYSSYQENYITLMIFSAPLQGGKKYASATVHYKTITFWETPFMNSNFGSYQK